MTVRTVRAAMAGPLVQSGRMPGGRRTIRRAIAVVILIGCAGCGESATEPARSYGPWEGSITTEGRSTVVRNRSGAIWEGPAGLVEELSIGVEEGPEEYMLGSVGGIATDGSRILVADRSIPVLRVYDREGRHLQDWGRGGEGPGELLGPFSITRDGRGRFHVLDEQRHRIVTFDTGGDFLHEIALDGGSKSIDPIVAVDGRVWAKSLIDRNRPGLEGWGYRGYAEDGSVRERLGPELDHDPALLVGPGPPCPTMPVPYTPQYTLTMLADGSIAAGTGETYRVVVERPDGRRLIVERSWDSIPLLPDQKTWRRRYEHAFLLHACGAAWTWRGPDLPDSYPAYHSLLATGDGGFWVVRHAGAEPVPESRCDVDPELDGSRPGAPCWPDRHTVDAFGPDGRYLGEVLLPEGLPPRRLLSAWIDGDVAIFPITDTAGVIRVREYRLVPGGTPAREGR